MKKIKSIKNLFGENLPLDKMEIVFVGHNYVVARPVGCGMLRTYAPYDGYKVEFEG